MSSDDVELILRLIATHPHWSRNRLSIAVSEQFNWRTATGQLKDMSARLLLAELAESGLIQLQLRLRRGGRQRLRVLSESELFWLASQSAQPMQSPLEALRPLEVLLIEARTKEANDFICHLHHHHYLAFGGASGQNLRYLIRDCSGRDLACVLFAGAAWKVKAQDQFIGWSPEQRRRQLGLIVNLATGAAGVQLGPRALALAADLNKAKGLSMRKTCLILRDCFNLKLSAGGLSQALDRLATKLQCQYQAIVKELRKAAVVHSDETS